MSSDDDDYNDSQQEEINVVDNWVKIKRILGLPSNLTKISLKNWWEDNTNEKPSDNNEDCLAYYIEYIKAKNINLPKKKIEDIERYISSLSAIREPKSPKKVKGKKIYPIEVLMEVINLLVKLESDIALLGIEERSSNFPEYVSESIVAHILTFCKQGEVTKPESGDLKCGDEKVEVKCFSSPKETPSTFGPTEKWDFIIFLNAREWRTKKFTCYKINLSDESEEWRNIVITKKGETYADQCERKVRPHISFERIWMELSKNNVEIQILFNGFLDNLIQRNELKTQEAEISTSGSFEPDIHKKVVLFNKLHLKY
jgi:hypothetical protein